MNASIGALIQQIIPQIRPSVEILLNQITAPVMTVTVDSLINQLIPLTSANGTNLAAAAKAGVLEAVVVSSQLLSTVGKPLDQSTLLKTAQPIAPEAQQFKTDIKVNNQSFELITKLPIPKGSRIQLTIAQNNLATIINVSSPISSQADRGITNKQLTSAQSQAALITQTNNSQKAIPTQNNTSPAQTTASNYQSVIEQGLREALPQQQPLRNLLPLLREITQQPLQQIPKKMLQDLNTLLKQFPTSQQLQQSKQLQQAINNNGIFFEAKLAQSPSELQAKKIPTANNQTTTNSMAAAQMLSPPLQLINHDVKAQLQQLLLQLAKATTPSTAAQNTEEKKQQLTYAQPILSTLNLDTSGTATKIQASSEQNLDILLRQLSSQLLSTLARIQLNQLESLANRQQNSPDNQGPINSWTMEMPILHGKNIDNLELRIDQHTIDDEEGNNNHDGKKLWVVMLDFDLHSLGKMNIQLKIVEQQVSAIVWSQIESTHREVKQQIKYLTENLEKVGVKVKQVDCKLGLPPKNNLPIYKQLVDIRT
jgi:hypothetical protein